MPAARNISSVKSKDSTTSEKQQTAVKNGAKGSSPPVKGGKSAKAAPTKLGNGGFVEYLKGVRAEWDKISWPTMPQIWAQSIVVVVMVSLVTLGIWMVDSLFRLIIGWVTPT